MLSKGILLLTVATSRSRCNFAGILAV